MMITHRQGVAFLGRMDDTDLEYLISIVLFAGFFADILSKKCESVLRSQYTTYIFSKVPEYARGDNNGAYRVLEPNSRFDRTTTSRLHWSATLADEPTGMYKVN